MRLAPTCRRLALCLSALGSMCLPLGGLAQSDTSGVRGIILQPPQRPYTDTMAAMMVRDAQWRAEIEEGLRPRPPHIIAAGNHVRGPMPQSDGDGPFELFLPAVFHDPDPELRETQDWRLLAPQTIGASFIGINLQDQFSMGTGWIPPDTGGAIGPGHFLEVINGSVAVYTRAGARLSHVTLNSFMTVSSGGVTYPRSYAFDPRCVYDRRSGRWFITALEHNGGGNNHAILAVSRTSNPTGTWDKYVIEVGRSGWFTDYPTLGVDDNGVYIPVTLFGSSTSRKIIAATRKASLIGSPPSLDTVYLSPDTREYYATPYAAVNLDPTPSMGKAWFVGSNPSYYRDMRIGYLTWPESGPPTFTEPSNLTLPAFAHPPSAPQMGSTTNIDSGDMRMHSALLRNGRLWTCRTIGVNAVGGSTGADRTAVEWIELDVSGASPTIVQSGRLYDGAPSSPVFFYYPSVAVNGLGQMALSFSDSSGNRYVAAETTGRLATDVPGTLQSVMNIKPGANTYVRSSGGANRWGDYSTTSVDPNDDLSIWTIQEYATASKDIWGTWIAQLLAPAPTLDNPSGSAPAGTTGVALDLTGTGLFDPGTGFPNRLTVQLTGGTINGISNYAVSYNSPTNVTVTFDIASNATVGSRTIVLTNPDGQQAVVTDGFSVTEARLTTLTVSPASGRIGQTVSLEATLMRQSDSSPLPDRTVTFQIAGSSVGDASTNASGVAALPYPIPESIGTGTVTIRADFGGDGTYQPSFGTADLSVGQGDTTLVADDVNAQLAATVNLTARLTCTDNSLPLSGKTVAFSVAGTGVGSAVADGSGVATLAYTVPAEGGPRTDTIVAEFGGDTLYTGSSDSADLIVGKADTSLAVQNAMGRFGDSVGLEATLLRATDGTPLAGRIVVFSIEGAGVGEGTTDAAGTARMDYTIPEAMGGGSKAIGAAFAGDSDHNATTGSATLDVIPWPTTLTLDDAAGTVSLATTLSATLIRSDTAAPLEGRVIVFTAAGTSAGSAATDASGVASTAYVIPDTIGSGDLPLEASFAGDSHHAAASDTATLTVSKAGTTQWTIDRTGIVTTLTTLRQYDLKRTTDNALLQGKTITYRIDGSAVGTAATDAGGDSFLNWIITDGPASRTITTEFAGDSAYTSSSANATLTAQTVSTKMVGVNRTAQISAYTILRAWLYRFDNAPLPGKSVSFHVDGTLVGSAITQMRSGLADAQLGYIVPDGAGAGVRTIVANWAGDGGYLPSSATNTLTAQKTTPYIWVMPRTCKVGTPVSMYAYFRRLPDYQKQGNKPVDFRVDGTLIHSMNTDGNGVAYFIYQTTQPVGTYTIRCEYAGDPWVSPGFGEATLTVL